jgi:hypothetical protein
MRHKGISDAEAARRKAAIIRHIKAGWKPAQVAVNFNLSYRYIKMVAKDAGLAKPRGRPLGSTKQVKARPRPPERAGYALQRADAI